MWVWRWGGALIRNIFASFFAFWEQLLKSEWVGSLNAWLAEAFVWQCQGTSGDNWRDQAVVFLRGALICQAHAKTTLLALKDIFSFVVPVYFLHVCPTYSFLLLQPQPQHHHPLHFPSCSLRAGVYSLSAPHSWCTWQCSFSQVHDKWCTSF